MNTVACPNCGMVLSNSPDVATFRIACPRCGTEFPMPPYTRPPISSLSAAPLPAKAVNGPPMRKKSSHSILVLIGIGISFTLFCIGLIFFVLHSSSDQQDAAEFVHKELNYGLAKRLSKTRGLSADPADYHLKGSSKSTQRYQVPVWVDTRDLHNQIVPDYVFQDRYRLCVTLSYSVGSSDWKITVYKEENSSNWEFGN